MRLVEVGKVLQRCGRRADIGVEADDEGDEHVSDEERLELLDESYGELCSLVSSAGLRYFERATTLTTDGTNRVDEPAAVMATVGVWYVTSEGKKRRIAPLMPHELEEWSGRTGSEAHRYELVDGYLYFFPTPPTGQSYELRYVPQPPDISGFASDECIDTIAPDGYAFLVWSFTVKVKAKKEEDARLAMVERDKHAKTVYEWAVNRAITEAPRRVVSDVDLYPREEGSY